MRRVIDKIVVLRPGEGRTALLMFAYSFLAMASYNIVKPITRSKFIYELGADNLPYVQFVAGLLIAGLIQLYVRAGSKLPRRALIPVTQLGLMGLLLVFWVLLRTGAAWVPVAFYLFGLIFGILLISQFWTLANDIFDARQAKRVFGFIGGGASLGGALAGGILAGATDAVGTNNLLLLSAAGLAACAAIVMTVTKRQPATVLSVIEAEEGVGAGEAIRLLRGSRHLQVIALVVGLAAIGAVTIEQQLNMAIGAAGETEDAITKFLGSVTLYVSLIGFFLQVGLTSRIHRSMGLTFALLLLPVSLGATGVLIMATGLLWAPMFARVLDSSLRYTIDKTTREILFLPLSPDVKYRAKPFVDITVDRMSKAVGSLALLVLIKPWGLGLGWVQLSYFSLGMMVLWVAFALVARREYLRSFRRSLESRDMEPASVRLDMADPATIEALVEGLGSPDEAAVLYAIEMLETLDKRRLVTPLLLHHESAAVRTRALAALEAAGAERAQPWTRQIERLLKDPDPGVRAAAVGALAVLEGGDAAAVLRRCLEDADPRVVVTAAAGLADSTDAADVAAAERTFDRVVHDTGALGSGARADAAAALGRVQNRTFRSLLVPLIHDPDVSVAQEAIASARALGPSDALFMPALVSRLGHRTLKAQARDTLTSYGDDVIAFLAHTLADPDEQPWVRRHVPATLAFLPGQPAMDALVAAIDDPDGFLRYKIISAIATLRRAHPELVVPEEIVERFIARETGRFFTYLTLRYNLVRQNADAERSLLVTALTDKMSRARERAFMLLGLVHDWQDVSAARDSIERGDARRRAAGLEYLDNVLGGVIRKRIMGMLDDAPIADRVRQANSLLKSRPRDVPDTLAQLVHEDDPVVAAAAIHFAGANGHAGTLTDDFEYIAAHRASEALIAGALASVHPAGGRAASSDRLPVVELADRLRHIPLFGFMSIDEVFRVARTAREVHLRPGVVFCREGEQADQVLFLLDGIIRVARDGNTPDRILAPAALNFVDMIEGRPLRHTIEAAEPAIGLTLRAKDFQTMLADNIAAAQGLFRMLLGPDRPGAPPALMSPLTATASVQPRDGDPMDPVEVARLLRRAPIFGRATPDHLKYLVAMTHEVALTVGDVIGGEGYPDALHLVVEGAVRLETAGAAPVLLGPGSMIGVRETLARTPAVGRLVVDAPGRALRITADDLFEVLADQADLLQGVFCAVLSSRSEGSPNP